LQRGGKSGEFWWKYAFDVAEGIGYFLGSMRSISIELVPRDWETLRTQFAEISTRFPQINVLNIPDLMRFSIRSWEGCAVGKEYFPKVIPHLRAIDFNLRERFGLADRLAELDIQSVLVITGDLPQDMSRRVYRNSSLELIRVLKKEAPKLEVFAGIDPYRSSLRAELDYAQAKMDAGADGFFTQPFFDLRLLDIYMEHISLKSVFWGVCPVTSEKGRAYWESKNLAVFPKDYGLGLDANVGFARELIRRVWAREGNVYFMPIRAEPVSYLAQVLS
jgi:methylenetetrahydrofolate reductase (NADPH)